MARDLKQVLDQSDAFMGSHRIVRPRTYKRDIPKWTTDNTKVRAVLLNAFPKLATVDNQRDAAARWATVIHLYFRMGYTRGQIAEELCTTTERVKNVIRSIYRVAAGRRANGTGNKVRRIKGERAPQ